MTRFAAVLEHARSRGRAVGAFTCYNLETAEAVIVAAEARHAPAILLVSSGVFRARRGERLVRALQGAARGARVDVLVEVDHIDALPLVERAAQLGVDAVMADGSRLPFDANVDLTEAARRLIGERDIGLEAELGRVEGREDRAEGVMGGTMTAPDEVARFLTRCRVDCLAVGIGNVHGRYIGPPALDWERLGQIRTGAAVALALHGSSGLPDGDLRRAVAAGVAKLNLNTELRAAYFARAQEIIPTVAAALDLAQLCDTLVEAVTRVVDAKLALFGWGEDHRARRHAQ